MSKKTTGPLKISPEFLRVISTRAKEEEDDKPIPANMEFPLLDEMEMDVPLFGDFVDHEGEFLDDESDIDMQCMIHVNPSLAMSSLSL